MIPSVRSTLATQEGRRISTGQPILHSQPRRTHDRRKMPSKKLRKRLAYCFGVMTVGSSPLAAPSSEDCSFTKVSTRLW